MNRLLKTLFPAPASWSRFIPPELQPDARKLIDWLTYRPFQEPEYCPFCHSKSFNVRERPGCKPSYQCDYCRKTFARTTGTLFYNTQYPELWAEFARWRFSGLGLKKIAAKIGITEYACRHRDVAIMQEMADEYPRLHAWWDAHQDRASLEVTPEVDTQRARFREWLVYVLTTPRAPCPKCGYNSRRDSKNKDRPWFFCNPCKQGFSLLRNTPLKGMLYPELWLSFVDDMLSGESTWQLQHEHHICISTLYRWRTSFLAMMQTMGLDALVAWSEWQRSREYSNTLKRQKAGIVLPRPQKSRFNGRGQLKPK